MFRKIFVCAVFLAAICLAGCGTEKIVGTPDKAVLAYAEISMLGESDNMAAAGFSEDDKKEIRYRLANTFVDSMKPIAPLSEASAQEVTDLYFKHIKDKITFRVTLKKDDAEHPIVDITTTPIDQTASAKLSAGSDEILSLIGMVGKLKSEGATDDQLKDNAEVQKLAVTALGKYIDNIQFQAEQTLEVPCKMMTGHDGKVHWAPANEEAFVNFLTGNS